MKALLHKRCLLLLLVLLPGLLPWQGCSTGKWGEHRQHDRYRYLRERRLSKLPAFDLPVVVNDRVIAWLDYFQGPGRHHFQRYLERSGRYQRLMQQILAEERMPMDLVYISLIESGFNPNARSHANAVGTWQFIRSTGVRYGMRVNPWLDERRDVVLSTRAAARYFRDLHAEFGDWYLAMAGYNAGEGRVRRALQQSRGRDFWAISAPGTRYLRPETRDYVPKFLAAMLIAKTPEKYGFRPQYQEPLSYDVVRVETQTDLSVIARASGAETAEIRELNPQLVRFATPAGERDVAVRIPRGKEKAFYVAYAAIPQEQRIALVYHTVRRGDTLAKIAHRYRITGDAIAQANGIAKSRRLTAGHRLVIPVAGTELASVDTAALSREASSEKRALVRHRVRSGDTLSAIAQNYGVTVESLKKWNGIHRPRDLRAGRSLKVYAMKQTAPVEEKTGVALIATAEASEPAPQMHTLAAGETLGLVGQRYGVRASEIMKWNKIRNPRRVRAGTSLKIYARADLQAPLQKVAAPEIVAIATPETAVAEKELSYRIRSGDTLWDIARKHGVSIADLKAWNNLTNPSKVKPGTELVIKKQAR